MNFKLSDVAEFQKGFAFKSKDFINSGVPIVKVTNLTDESIDCSGCVFISPEMAEEYKRYDLRTDDIVITTVGSWPTNPASVVGKVVIVPMNANGSLLNQNAVRIRANNKIQQKYLYYYLRDQQFRDYIIGTAQGSANQASITQNDLKNYDLEVPSDVQQIATANVLSTLDKKIEINNQINKTLENMAQAVFTQWFVDFEFPNEDGEPYKSSGGEMVESELGMIPKGWEVVEFRELFKFIKGKKPKVIDDYKFENSQKYLTIDVLNRKSILFASKEKTIGANDNDVLMVMDGASSGTIYFGQEGIVASTLAKLDLINNRVSNQLLFYMVKFFEDDIKSHTTGSAIPHTDKEFTYRIKIALPKDIAMQTRVNEILSNISDTFITREQENAMLKITRDTLLPKIISGEIRVPIDKN